MEDNNPLKVIKGTILDENIQNIKNDIMELYKNIFSDTKHETIESASGMELGKYDYLPTWVILTWYNKPIAMATFVPKISLFQKHVVGQSIYLYNFGVRPLRRKEGFGKILFEEVRKYALETAIDLGYKKFIILMSWLVKNDNYNAKIFYTKLGALATGKIREDAEVYTYDLMVKQRR